jgi:hypothetical protein
MCINKTLTLGYSCPAAPGIATTAAAAAAAPCHGHCCCCCCCSELGKITLDKTFEEREALNAAIVASINAAAEAWGLQCMRYEIKDITPPSGVLVLLEHVISKVL